MHLRAAPASRYRLALSRVDPTQIDRYLASLPVRVRNLAEGEWGIVVEADSAAEPSLELSLRAKAGVLEARAFALPAAMVPDAQTVLHWNRHVQMVRFGTTLSGELWVEGEVPLKGLHPSDFDRLLAMVTTAVQAARSVAF